ncbi:peroxisomal membrane anchor protein (Pex14p) conserved region domain-containing protein [Sarocladium implicatum]|nr:peroxisomal membrane anchor protein (Pex14p) conserved region domain-containing protein [Sarocladium implicatum]
MVIREELVASATQFLQDPSVASSSVENRISFLRSKNLTQEEIDAALARSGGTSAPPPPPAGPYGAAPSGPPQNYYQPYPPNAWQPPQAPPRRDWRDWFIMATVVGGVSYGLYSLGKRYVYPLVAPPTPEKLEQDKKSIEEQFDRAFSLVEQLAKDTEELKAAEQKRTERLDAALLDVEAVVSDLKASNRRREDDAQKIRDEINALKEAVPKAMQDQRDVTDNRMREVNGELASLKTLMTQRMAASSSAQSANPLRPTSGNTPQPAKVESATGSENATEGENNAEAAAAPKSARASSFKSGRSAGGKASIPAWQMAMAQSSTGEGASGQTNGASSSSS